MAPVLPRASAAPRLSATLAGYEKRGRRGEAFFEILVFDGKREWSLHKCHRDFECLAHTLQSRQDLIDASALSALPRKPRGFWQRFSNRPRDQHYRELGRWVRLVATEPCLATLPDVLEFLKPPEAARGIAITDRLGIVGRIPLRALDHNSLSSSSSTEDEESSLSSRSRERPCNESQHDDDRAQAAIQLDEQSELHSVISNDDRVQTAMQFDEQSELHSVTSNNDRVQAAMQFDGQSDLHSVTSNDDQMQPAMQFDERSEVHSVTSNDSRVQAAMQFDEQSDLHSVTSNDDQVQAATQFDEQSDLYSAPATDSDYLELDDDLLAMEEAHIAQQIQEARAIEKTRVVQKLRDARAMQEARAAQQAQEACTLDEARTVRQVREATRAAELAEAAARASATTHAAVAKTHAAASAADVQAQAIAEVRAAARTAIQAEAAAQAAVAEAVARAETESRALKPARASRAQQARAAKAEAIERKRQQTWEAAEAEARREAQRMPVPSQSQRIGTLVLPYGPPSLELWVKPEFPDPHTVHSTPGPPSRQSDASSEQSVDPKQQQAPADLRQLEPKATLDEVPVQARHSFTDGEECCGCNGLGVDALGNDCRMCYGCSTLLATRPRSETSSRTTAVSAVTEKFLDKVRGEKEIQRINCSHTAAAVLEIHHVSADVGVIVATYLSKGVQVHRLMTNNSDADFAFARLTAAYLHFTEGEPWYFGRRGEVPDIDPDDDFEVFQEVAATVPPEQDGEVAEVGRLRAHCADLAARYHAQSEAGEA